MATSYRRRERERPLFWPVKATGSWYYANTGQSGTYAPLNVGASGKQITVSRGNQISLIKQSGRSGRSSLDVGGSFYTKKLTYRDPNPKKTPSVVIYDIQGQGFFLEKRKTPLFAKAPFSSFMPDADSYVSSDAFLSAIGTEAIARCKPTNSVADLSVSLAEIAREGLPRLVGSQMWKDRTLTAKNAGSEYLNYQFGWQPLVGEIKNLAVLAEKSDKIWKQYARDAGRLVRRRYEFPIRKEVVFSQTTPSSAPYGLAITGELFQNNSTFNGTLYQTDTLTQRRWFEGGFMYWIPEGGFGREAAEARKLYGLTLDPEVIWNLSPWSWLVDWGANVGSVLANLSDAITDGLVMPYGYMMEETILHRTYELVGMRLKSQPQLNLRDDYFSIVKKRVPASPYGFGLTWESFSPYQLSILAALGITRRP